MREANQKIKREVKQIKQDMLNGGLLLNVGKTEIMLMKKKRDEIVPLSIEIDGRQIAIKRAIKYTLEYGRMKN